MSMNLYFETVDGLGFVDFPFQTPTDLTYEVLAAEGTEERLSIIKREMDKWGWSEEIQSGILSSAKALMNNEHLRLTVL